VHSLVALSKVFTLIYLKSSDLRKQSLYLKFDPFLSRDDPDVHPCTGRKSDIIDLTSRLSLHRQTLQTPVKPVESKCSKPEMPDFLCDSPRTFLSEMLFYSFHNPMCMFFTPWLSWFQFVLSSGCCCCLPRIPSRELFLPRLLLDWTTCRLLLISRFPLLFR